MGLGKNKQRVGKDCPFASGCCSSNCQLWSAAQMECKLVAKTRFGLAEDDWGLVMLVGEDGFVVKDKEGGLHPFQNAEADEDEENPISAAVKMFWWLIDFLNLNLSRYARGRIRVITEVGDKYVLQKGERLVSVHYYIVKKDDEILEALEAPSKEEQ